MEFFSFLPCSVVLAGRSCAGALRRRDFPGMFLHGKPTRLPCRTEGRRDADLIGEVGVRFPIDSSGADLCGLRQQPQR